MNTNLTSQDWSMILDSLEYTKLKFENYEKYPSQEYKQQRINEIRDLIVKVSAARNKMDKRN